MKLKEAIKGQRTVVIYPGRFQPMGSHHFQAYKHLVSKFGKANVFVATSDKTGDKSPLNFNEKKKVISAYGIPAKQIVKVKNPYRSDEITSKLPDDTAVLWAVGAKDGDRLVSGKYFDKYKKGDDLSSYKDRGYIYIVPHVSLKVNGQEMSGTAIRQALSNKDLSPKERKDIFKQITGFNNPSIEKMLLNKLA